MIKEYIETIGLRTDEYMMDFYDSEGLYHDDLGCAVWCGIFGFCACGDMNYELERIYDTMKILNQEDRKDCDEMYDVKNGYQIYLYLLDKHGFTEHGFSIYGSWLTEKGKALMAVIQYILNGEI